jgi:hypothetical protein
VYKKATAKNYKKCRPALSSNELRALSFLFGVFTPIAIGDLDLPTQRAPKQSSRQASLTSPTPNEVFAASGS